jgi:hypothetical protein
LPSSRIKEISFAMRTSSSYASVIRFGVRPASRSASPHRTQRILGRTQTSIPTRENDGDIATSARS